MNWQPYAGLQRGETVGFELVLTQTPQVKAVVIFYQPEGFWYAALYIGGRRLSNYTKALTEEDAKERALEQARQFSSELVAALFEQTIDELGEMR